MCQALTIDRLSLRLVLVGGVDGADALGGAVGSEVGLVAHEDDRDAGGLQCVGLGAGGVAR